MSPYMIGKFGKYCQVCHLALLEDSIESEQGPRSIGILLTLNSNLEPSILGVVMYKNVDNLC